MAWDKDTSTPLGGGEMKELREYFLYILGKKVHR